MVGRIEQLTLTTLLALTLSAASLRAVEVQDITRLKGAESSKLVGPRTGRSGSATDRRSSRSS